MNEYLKPDYERYVPVFGDIHGNLEGLVNTVKYLQKKYNKKFNFVFQLGDFGYFPFGFCGEKIRGDLELGVHRYFTDQKVAEKYLNDDRIQFRIIFIRGNHEDQETLEKLCLSHPEGLISLDKKGFVNFLPDGRALSIPYNQGDVSIAAYGGVDKNTGPKISESNNMSEFNNSALQILLGFSNYLNILLTHQGPKESKKGSENINVLYQLINPRLGIHGHSHVFSHQGLISSTNSCSLGKMPLEKNPFVKSRDFYGFIDLKKIKLSTTIESP